MRWTSVCPLSTRGLVIELWVFLCTDAFKKGQEFYADNNLAIRQQDAVCGFWLSRGHAPPLCQEKEGEQDFLDSMVGTQKGVMRG